MSDANQYPQELGISEADWQQTPASVRAVLVTMHQRLAKLEEQLQLNSGNSSQPPSSDKPRHQREKKGKLPSGKKRGGQPGHKGQSRPLVPPEAVREFRMYKPEFCEHCGETLSGDDPSPVRWQVTDLPPITPVVIEHQVHRLRCGCCGQSTRGQLPPEVTRSQFGPGVTAVVGWLIGQERLSKRQVKRVLQTVFGIQMAVGSGVARQQEISDSLAEVYETVQAHVHQAAHRNIDETPWREGWQRAWLSSVATPAATLFRVADKRDAAVAQALLGASTDQVSTSDRFTAYNWLDDERHQTCWAHLLRTWRRFQLRDGPSAQVGGMLEIHTDYLLHRWRELQRRHLSWFDFLAEVPQHQRAIHHWLEIGARLDHKTTAATCRRLLRHQPMLWTFTRYAGGAPTNNAVERALRHGVIWRKLCYGTASERGSRFVERLLTVIATTHQQGHDVLNFLSAALHAYRHGEVGPPLLLGVKVAKLR
jgi:transposase